ncbi:MAG TPA: histidine kinase dimerization/phospho-acceptor domain-containing protein [Thermomicrobiales bacterium]|nr:histidine kinase dimerization/phospho-acceptor domain-containing protein [Thermomicrobiales bacterium]
MGKRDRRRPTRARRREAASAASFFAPSPDELGLRPLPSPDEAAGSGSLLVAAMSQELRTPMNTILGYAHLLLDDAGPSLTSQQREDLRQLQASAVRLARAIDAVIELSRLESGRSELAVESTDMIALAAEARRRIVAANGGDAVRITLTHDAGPLCADVDPMRFLDALVAIGRDLLQLSPNRALAITLQRDGADCVVAIAAEPEADMAATRQPARRPAAALPWGAPALDIAAAALLVELLGGALAVEAEPDVGSRVILRLPRTPEERRPLGSREASE